MQFVSYHKLIMAIKPSDINWNFCLYISNISNIFVYSTKLIVCFDL